MRAAGLAGSCRNRCPETTISTSSFPEMRQAFQADRPCAAVRKSMHDRIRERGCSPPARRDPGRLSTTRSGSQVMSSMRPRLRNSGRNPIRTCSASSPTSKRRRSRPLRSAATCLNDCTSSDARKRFATSWTAASFTPPRNSFRADRLISPRSTSPAKTSYRRCSEEAIVRLIPTGLLISCATPATRRPSAASFPPRSGTPASHEDVAALFPRLRARGAFPARSACVQ